ncbi:PTS mannose/fructose/sorbose transporter subunit IIAB [Tetragenococcus halophilus]|uniref:PTS mannose/fructose/sorbose transporter subunit IIAB n=1 Tax=Tetragenococcus halophilus TaxID=51669 RepID=UPI0015BABB56|nr:PTS transporter subunit IIB [Tetragenococcus halophilus]
MKNVVLISHGQIAEGVKSSLEMLIGETSQIYVVSLREDGDATQFENDFLAIMKSLQNEVVVIADLLGGTPCNTALKYYKEDENVTILAGMSLPLVMEAALNEEASVKDLIKASHMGTVDVKRSLVEEENSIEDNKTKEDLSPYADYVGKANIVNARIDERLIHGQVAGIWTTSLDAQRIIVINDEAANDPLQKSSLRMAAPASMRLSVLRIEDAVKNINAGKYGLQRLFVLFKNPTDVWSFIQKGGKLDSLNVGNMSYKEGTKEITKSIKILPEEEKAFYKIAEQGVKIIAQLVPNDPKVNFMDKLNDENKEEEAL